MEHLGELASGEAALEAELEAARAARDAADFHGAMVSYDAVLAQQPTHATALAGKGAALRALGQVREALPVLLQALKSDSLHLEGRLELALTLQSLGRSDEARAIFTTLIRNPEPPAQAWHGLALLLLGDGHEAAAETALRRAIAQAPDLIEARQQLADLLARRQDLAAAVDLYHDILAMDADNAAALTGLGQALIGLGRSDEASDQIERSLALKPDNPYAHLARARLNLLDGQLQGAWDDLEWRWAANGRKRPEPPGQRWNGDDDLHGHTILLWAEQGLAETIHLLRHVGEVVPRADKVVLGVPEPLLALAASIPGVSLVLASGQQIPVDVSIDYNASLGDLPRLFATTLNGVPAGPFLTVPAGRRVPVQAPATALMKVGLCWSGPRAAWSIPFPELMPLLGHPGAAFFGLQLGSRGKDAAQLAHPCLITDLAPTVSDFADLAGRIAEMDLVITVDGAVAHLAGAMGKPVWVLLPLAPDWRWMRGRSDSPWYASARLFRQGRAGDWISVVSQVMMALEDKLEAEKLRRRNLAHAQSGADARQRAFLSTHLAPGDLYVDVGCGSAAPHVLDVASQDVDDIRVVAVEAVAGEAALLDDTVAISGLSEIVTVEQAVIGAEPAPVAVAARKRSGRSIFPLPAWVRARQQCLPLSHLLDRQPGAKGRRLILRLGLTGSEVATLAGLGEYHPAIVVFEQQDSRAAAWLRQQGYTLYQFADATASGAVEPLAAAPTTVLALAAGLSPAPIYGDAGDPTSLASMSKAVAAGAKLAAQGCAELSQGRANRAGITFAQALAHDPANVDANANLGGLLRRIGRADAAASCWRRAMAAGAPPMVRANLANVLREGGHLVAAEAEFLQVLAQLPDNANVLHAFGLLERQRGRPREALGLFERAEMLHPGTVGRQDLASALLKSGNLARGMAEMAGRRPAALPTVTAPDWDGARLQGRTILIRDEDDPVDTIMLARYIPMVALQGGLVEVECVAGLAPLLAGLAGVERVTTRGEQPPPATDVTVRLLDVPRLLGTTSRTTPPRTVPYLRLPEGVAPFHLPDARRLHAGISWIGTRPRDRGLPLSLLMRLAAEPAVDLVSLQRGERAADLVATGNRLFVEDMGSQCRDLVDLAAIIAGLDVVITTDTVEAHLAGAMGKPVWVLLPLGNDWRWVDDRDDSVWYPTMRVFRQATDGSWTRALARVAEALAAMAAGKRGRRN